MDPQFWRVSAIPAGRYRPEGILSWNFGEKTFFLVADFRPEMADMADLKKNLESRWSEVSEKYRSCRGLVNIQKHIWMSEKVSDFTTTSLWILYINHIGNITSLSYGKVYFFSLWVFILLLIMQLLLYFG